MSTIKIISFFQILECFEFVNAAKIAVFGNFSGIVPIQSRCRVLLPSPFSSCFFISIYHNVCIIWDNNMWYMQECYQISGKLNLRKAFIVHRCLFQAHFYLQANLTTCMDEVSGLEPAMTPSNARMLEPTKCTRRSWTATGSGQCW